MKFTFLPLAEEQRLARVEEVNYVAQAHSLLNKLSMFLVSVDQFENTYIYIK